MPEALALILALGALTVALGAAVLRPRWMPEPLAAAGGAGLLVAAGALSLDDARGAVGELGPTVGFLAALLVLAAGCRGEGLFEALGARLAGSAGGQPRRLLAAVFAVAIAVTTVLSLDATVVFLTPVVLATALRLDVRPRPHVYATAHLANSASLLLPVSNLTNLLAFHASGLSFTRFAALMALPTVAVVAVEWAALSRRFAVDLDGERARAAPAAPAPLPRFALAVLGLTLAGFGASSALGVEPVWVAVAGAIAISVPRLARGRVTPPRLLGAAEPGFLLFVLGLGVIVSAASANGLAGAVRALVPAGDGLAALLAIAAASALLANVVNNLPATLMLTPVLAAAGPLPLLAGLIGLNVGPNLTYAGSLATLLWRRVLQRHGEHVPLREFTGLGLLTVPLALLLATTALWISAQLLL